MSSLYQEAGQMIANWYGEDAATHVDPFHFARQIVDAVVREIEEHGMPSLDKAAAHDVAAAD